MEDGDNVLFIEEGAGSSGRVFGDGIICGMCASVEAGGISEGLVDMQAVVGVGACEALLDGEARGERGMCGVDEGAVDIEDDEAHGWAGEVSERGFVCDEVDRGRDGVEGYVRDHV